MVFCRRGGSLEQDWPYQFNIKPSKNIIQNLKQVGAPVLGYIEQVYKDEEMEKGSGRHS